MSSFTAQAASPEEPDALLKRLRDNYTRQKSQAAAQKRKQADIELQAAAAYSSNLPVTLELLSDKTAALFSELQRLVEAKQDFNATTSREAALLQHIRTAVNQELRQSMGYIEEGYCSGFEKLMRQSRVNERRELSMTSLPVPLSAAATTTTVAAAVATPAAATNAAGPAPVSPPSVTDSEVHLSVQEALSEHLSLTAESLAVLLQCEIVRIYLYDRHETLRCAAQFPFRARRADPAQSSSLALMTVREIHQTVCRDHLAVSGTVNPSSSAAGSLPSPPPVQTDVDDKGAVSGVEDVHSCLLFPILPTNSTGNALGMIYAVNKRFPVPVSLKEGGNIEAPVRGFGTDDEVLVENTARLLSTSLTRYPADAFTSAGIGETLRRRAHPKDPTVGSLSAHLRPTLHDAVEAAVEVGQDGLSRTLPTLVYRAPVSVIYGTRTSLRTKRRDATGAGDGESNDSVATTAFRLRCMNELWVSGRDDNTSLHRQYRELEEAAQKTRLLLRNVLDGVATARCMPVTDDVAQYLQTLEVYGRSAQNERAAAFVADAMMKASQQKERAVSLSAAASNTAAALVESGGAGMTDGELRRLQHDHARQNTVTVAALHYDGPDGIPAYTADPAKKLEQIRFIDELRRSEAIAGVMPPAAGGSRRGRKPNVGAPWDGEKTSTSPHTSLPRLTAPSRLAQSENYPFQRPFKQR